MENDKLQILSFSDPNDWEKIKESLGVLVRGKRGSMRKRKEKIENKCPYYLTGRCMINSKKMLMCVENDLVYCTRLLKFFEKFVKDCNTKEKLEKLHKLLVAMAIEFEA